MIQIDNLTELKRGGIYALRVTAQLSQPYIEAITAQLKPAEEALGCKFLLLPPEVDLVDSTELREAVKTLLIEFWNAGNPQADLLSAIDSQAEVVPVGAD